MPLKLQRLPQKNHKKTYKARNKRKLKTKNLIRLLILSAMVVLALFKTETN
jgi:hypothetical protein